MNNIEKTIIFFVALIFMISLVTSVEIFRPEGSNIKHNDLDGLQGGLPTERYHLNQSAHDNVLSTVFNITQIITGQSIWDNSSTETFIKSSFPQNVNITENLTIFGRLGIGTTSPGAKLVVWDSTDVTSTGGGALRIGGSDTKLIAIDNNEIQAIADGGAGTLFLNDDGGTVSVHSVTDGIFQVNTDDFYITATGNVGINTTTPQHTLNVVGDGNFTGILYYGTLNGEGNLNVNKSDWWDNLNTPADINASDITDDNTYLQVAGDTGTGNFIFNQNFTVDTDTFFIDSSSNVIGIGTVTPSSQLHIYVDNADTVDSFTIEQDGTGDATMEFLLTGLESYGVGIDNDDGDAFKIDNNGPEFGSAEFQIQANNDVLLVKTGGNVGIGTASPDEGVEIANGALLITGRNSSSGIVLHLNNANPPLMQFSDGDIVRGKISTGSNIITGASPTGLGIYSSDSLAFSTNSDGVMRMIIDNSGNVGIGTSNPDGKLSIQSVGSSDTVNLLTFSEDENAEFYFESGFAGTGSTGNFLKLNTFWTNNSMVWRGDGNVGIGTISPSVLLEVSDATNPTFLVTDTTNTVSIGFQATDTLGVIGTSTNNDLIFETNNVEWMRIDNSGKIGIRTTGSNIDLAIGDSDTGFNQSADGVLDFRSNNAKVAGLKSDGRFYVYQVDNSAAENPACRESSGEITRGSAGCSTSSIRYKQNIQDLNYGLKEIMLLKPMTYEYKTDPSRIRFGMIAEEVAKILPETIGYEPDDPTLIQTYDKRDVQAVLIKAIQELKEENDLMKQSLCRLGEIQFC